MQLKNAISKYELQDSVPKFHPEISELSHRND